MPQPANDSTTAPDAPREGVSRTELIGGKVDLGDGKARRINGIIHPIIAEHARRQRAEFAAAGEQVALERKREAKRTEALDEVTNG